MRFGPSMKAFRKAAAAQDLWRAESHAFWAFCESPMYYILAIFQLTRWRRCCHPTTTAALRVRRAALGGAGSYIWTGEGKFHREKHADTIGIQSSSYPKLQLGNVPRVRRTQNPIVARVPKNICLDVHTHTHIRKRQKAKTREWSRAGTHRKLVHSHARLLVSRFLTPDCPRRI